MKLTVQGLCDGLILLLDRLTDFLTSSVEGPVISSGLLSFDFPF